MNNRLIEWAVTKRGKLVEHVGGDPSMGAWAASPGGVPVGAPGGSPTGMPGDMPAMEGGHCDCDCHETGGQCGCCAAAGGSACPTCGKMLMTDMATCDECQMAVGGGLDESEKVDEEPMKTCDECGGYMPTEAAYCEACGCSQMMESVILEAKKKKAGKKGPSMATQKKIAKTLVKKAGKGEDKEVSMTKLAALTKSWADEPYAAAQHEKQLAKK